VLLFTVRSVYEGNEIDMADNQGISCVDVYFLLSKSHLTCCCSCFAALLHVVVYVQERDEKKASFHFRIAKCCARA